MFADGSIVPLKSYKGVPFTESQTQDYVSGKSVRLDGCHGDYSTMFIKFNHERMAPGVFTIDPDNPEQTTTHTQGAGIRLSSPSFGGAPIQDEGFTHGVTLPDDFKLWLSRHPGLTFDEARSRYREEQKAKQRRKGPKLH